MKNKLIFVALFLTFFSIFWIISRSTSNESIIVAENRDNQSNSDADVVVAKASKQISETEKNETLLIESENISENLEYCNESQSCKINFEVKEHYVKLKSEKKNDAIEDLVVLLKEVLQSKINSEDERQKAKENLIYIISDFYSVDDKVFHLAQVYEFSEDYENALKTYLELDERAQKDPELERPYLNIAKIYNELGKYEEAADYYRLAISDPGYVEIKNYIIDNLNEVLEKMNNK